MKCLNCRTEGKHYQHKICPECTSDGITKKDIVVKSKQKDFIGPRAGEAAGKFVEKLKKDYYISGLQFFAKDEQHITVKWKQHEPNLGGSDGGKKANKS